MKYCFRGGRRRPGASDYTPAICCRGRRPAHGRARRSALTPFGIPAGAQRGGDRWGKEEGRIAQLSPRLAETKRFELLLTP